MAGTAGDEQAGRDPVDDLGEAWRWGVDASRQMGERLLQLYGTAGAAAFDGLAGDGGDELRRVRMDMERWVDLSVDLFDRAFSVMRGLAGEGQRADGNGHGAGPPACITLTGPAGAACRGELWVHNLAGGERRTPRLRCSALTSATGGEIAASFVCIEADETPLPGDASRRMTVVVEVPGDAAGTYHGHILSDASPDSVINLRLKVTDA